MGLAARSGELNVARVPVKVGKGGFGRDPSPLIILHNFKTYPKKLALVHHLFIAREKGSFGFVLSNNRYSTLHLEPA